MPSPCEDRYSRQGKEQKLEDCSPRCKSGFQYSLAVRRLKQSTYLPSMTIHSLYFSLCFLYKHAAKYYNSLPCWAGKHQHAHDRPVSRGSITQLSHTVREEMTMPSAFTLLIFSSTVFSLNAAETQKLPVRGGLLLHLICLLLRDKAATSGDLYLQK